MEEKNQVAPACPFMEGRSLFLQPLEPEHIEKYVVWGNDPEGRHYARCVLPQTIESLRKWISENSTYSQKATNMSFGIWLIDANRIIGDVGLYAINYADSNCWMGLWIGDKSCWGKGYATEAGELILDYAFRELGMHKVIVGIYSPNKASQGVARKLGFKLVGTNKDEIFVDGHFVDGFVYELYSHECEGFRE